MLVWLRGSITNTSGILARHQLACFDHTPFGVREFAAASLDHSLKKKMEAARAAVLITSSRQTEEYSKWCLRVPKPALHWLGGGIVSWEWGESMLIVDNFALVGSLWQLSIVSTEI